MNMRIQATRNETLMVLKGMFKRFFLFSAIIIFHCISFVNNYTIVTLTVEFLYF